MIYRLTPRHLASSEGDTERGSVLVAVLVFLALFGILIAAASTYASGNLKATTAERTEQGASRSG